MSYNSSNTVVCDIDIFISGYAILKCDNIEPSLLKEIRQKAKKKGIDIILVRDFDFNNETNLVEYINYMCPIIPRGFVLVEMISSIISAHEISNPLSSRDSIIKSILSLAGLEDAPDSFIISTYEEGTRLTYFESSNLVEELSSYQFYSENERGHYRMYTPEEDPDFDPDNKNIKIDESTKKIIRKLTKQIDLLRESGDYLMVLPIIEAYLSKIDDTKLIQTSSVLINLEYKIFLVDFDNLEVKLNSLTKCIYLLFLKHPEGILLSELVSYKDELTEYYLEVSNGEDYDLMKKRIDKIIDLKSNEIYVHLSRIKSFFYKKYHWKIADNYIISGTKNRLKKISLNESKIKWILLSDLY